MIIKNKIPKDFFITSGCGESENSIHCGSFHNALKNASIEQVNVMTYSSILPSIAKQVEKPLKIVHGEVMDTIMARVDGKAGKVLSAGIIIGWLFDKKTNDKIGGVVCECGGNYTLEKLKHKLNISLQEVYENGFNQYKLDHISTHFTSFVPQKKYATALVAICFTSYFLPKIK